jgi:serine/threonine-protein kinase
MPLDPPDGVDSTVTRVGAPADAPAPGDAGGTGRGSAPPGKEAAPPRGPGLPATEIAQTLTAAPGDPPAVPPARTAPPGGPAVPGYEVLGVLGRGGMGVVYKARQIALNRVVALKMILAGRHAAPTEVARFHREALAIARLQHPNVVQIFEVGECDGLPFFALEYCPGGSLTKKTAGHPLPKWEAAELVETLAGAIHTAHRCGIIHRDLKPSNVLLTEDGTVKVTDFGLAKELGAANGPTVSGTLLGTPAYMAPEQASGRAGEVGPPADVYALGAILYELLTGRPPFVAETPLETLALVVDQVPERPRRFNPSVDRPLEAVCLKCLEKDPADRYPSAGALAEELAAYRRGEPVLADGAPSLSLVRLMLRETRHVQAMARWGRIWQWQAVLIFVFFLTVNVLLWCGVTASWPYAALGAAGLIAFAIPMYHYRFRDGPRLTPVEWQLGQVWGIFLIAVLLTSSINQLSGLEAWKVLPFVTVELGMTLGCMAAVLGGSFYVLAAACAPLALVLVVAPQVGPVLFGTCFAAALWAQARQFRPPPGPSGTPPDGA